jgi:polysaccharide biosynthesis protein PslG
MKSLITRTLLLLTFVLSVSAIIFALLLHPFSARPIDVPRSEAIPDSYFGMTVHNLRTTPWPSIPFASMRSWDVDGVHWADIHQAPNTYNWSNLDALIDFAQRRGADIVYTFGVTPRWASASPDAKTAYGPGQCAPPANMQYWDEFVRAIVSHAGGKIRFWEIWNEPQDPLFYCGDVPTMVELQQRANRIIKTIDPSSMVLTPSPVHVEGPPWMSQFLAAGGGKYADIMAFHGYLDDSTDAESLIRIIQKFKAVFAAHGQEAKPVWDMEASWGEKQWLPNPDLQADLLAKFYLLHWSTGVERFYWYGYDNEKWGTLWVEKGGLQKPGIAYREVHKWLKGATMTTPCARSRALWTCNLARENGYRAMVLWSSAKDNTRASRISVPDEYRQYRDLDGNLQKINGGSVPISKKPILVETAIAF